MLSALNTFAGEGSLNYYGQHGFHKTQSAKTIGHGSVGIGVFLEGVGLNSIVEGDKFIAPINGGLDSADIELGSFTGFNAYPSLSVGISDYFDIGISLPIYAELINIRNKNAPNCYVGGYDCPDNLNIAGQGDVNISTKFRIPLNDLPINFALLLGGSIATGRTDAYGLWVRDPTLLRTDGLGPIASDASTYTSGNHLLKMGLATTFDFNKVRAQIPLLVHLNYGYRMPIGVDYYPYVQSLSAAVEFTPIPFLSLLGEFYTDFVSDYPKIDNAGTEDEAATSTLTLGASLNFTENISLQFGFQMLTGDAKAYIDNLSTPMNGDYAYYNAALIPKYMAFGGLTVKLFTQKEEVIEEEEEYRNPDTDEDGICDPWVSESGRGREFSDVCKGIDLCPYEAGTEGNSKGCPEVAAEPVALFTSSLDVIKSGEFVTLKWQTTNANSVEIDGIGSVEASGSRTVSPTETTIYTLTAEGDGGSKSASVEVRVTDGVLPTVMFSASAEAVKSGQPVTLKWQTTDATSASIEGIGVVPLNGTRTVSPTETTTYTLTAEGEGGLQIATVEVVVSAEALPTVMFSASAETIESGETVTLTWMITDATDVKMEGEDVMGERASGLGKISTKGTKKVKPTKTTTYTLTATGKGGSQTASVEVVVNAAPIEAKVNLKGVNFLSGKSELTPEAKLVLDGVAEQLVASPSVKIEIHGHTDSQGSQKANQELSERRAKAVVGYLAIKGVSMSRMKAVGFGPDVPIADNKTSAGRELNRRIEMIRVDK